MALKQTSVAPFLVIRSNLVYRFVGFMVILILKEWRKRKEVQFEMCEFLLLMMNR